MMGFGFAATAAMGAEVRGRALVASDGFSSRYDLDRIAGVFSRPEHKLAGRSCVGVVLILDRAKGGVATAWMLHEMAARGIVPAALVFNTVNPIMVQGSAFGGCCMMSGFDVDITTAIPDGATVELDPTADPPMLRVIDMGTAATGCATLPYRRCLAAPYGPVSACRRPARNAGYRAPPGPIGA